MKTNPFFEALGQAFWGTVWTMVVLFFPIAFLGMSLWDHPTVGNIMIFEIFVTLALFFLIFLWTYRLEIKAKRNPRPSVAGADYNPHPVYSKEWYMHEQWRKDKKS